MSKVLFLVIVVLVMRFFKVTKMSAADDASEIHEAAVDPAAAAKNRPILRSLLYGQYGNLFKFALWWVSLAPLTLALIGTSTSIGVGRIVYNVALSLFAPLGPIVCTRLGPRRVLLSGVLVRFLVWCVALPAVWAALYVFGMQAAHTYVYVAFCVMIFFDGVAVALTSFLDIDFCGVDAVAGTFGIEVDDDSRNYFNSRNELFFSLSFIVFAPLMAWGTLLYQHDVSNWVGHGYGSSATLGSVFTVTFLFASVIQVFFFVRIPPLPSSPPPPTDEHQAPLTINDDERANESPDSGEAPPPSPEFSTGALGALSDIKRGLGILCANQPVFFRILFLALEISVEDATIVVIASHCGLSLSWQGDGDAITGNVWTAMGVSCGKLGAMVASFFMMKHFQPPATIGGYWKLFMFVFLAAVASFGIPGAVTLFESHYIDAMWARVMYFASLFIFFFLSTLPKIGFQSLLQSMVADIPDGHLVFGLIAIFFTVIDSGMIMGLTIVFEQLSLEFSLWAASGFFLAHGVFEVILGPCLVLRGPDGGSKSDASDRLSVSTSASLKPFVPKDREEQE